MTSTIQAVALAGALALAAAAPVFAQQPPGMTNTWQPGPNASGDDTYQGSIDTPANGASITLDRLMTLSGWFVDTTAQGWTGADDLQVFLGTMDSGTLLGHATLGFPRPDVAAALNNPFWSASGWSAVVDPGVLALGPNTLNLYVHTPSKGWWFTQLSVHVSTTGCVVGAPVPAGGPIVNVSAPVDGERISDRLGNYRITGTARDRVAGPQAIDRVQVWLNGEQNTDKATFIGDADIFPDGSWEIDFSPSQSTPSGAYSVISVTATSTGGSPLSLSWGASSACWSACS